MHASHEHHARTRTRGTRLLLLGLALAGGLSCSSSREGMTREKEISLALELSRRYFDLGEMERAQGQAEKGLKLDPDNIDLRLTLGRVLQQRANRETITHAEVVFRRLLKDDKKDWRVPLALGEVLERKGLLYSEAARDIEAGIRYTDASDPQARADELNKVKQDSWEEALVQYEASLAIREGEEAVNGMQRANALLERNEESLRWSQKMLELVAVRKQSWREQLSAPQISAEDERRFRTRLSEDDAKEARTRLLASTTLRSMGRLEEAIDHLDLVLELEPELAQAYSRRASLQYELGNYQRAVDSIDHFLKAVADRDFDDPDVRRAYELRDEALNALARREKS